MILTCTTPGCGAEIRRPTNRGRRRDAKCRPCRIARDRAYARGYKAKNNSARALENRDFKGFAWRDHGYEKDTFGQDLRARREAALKAKPADPDYHANYRGVRGPLIWGCVP